MKARQMMMALGVGTCLVAGSGSLRASSDADGGEAPQLATWPVLRPEILPSEAAIALTALQGPAVDLAVSLGMDFFPGGSAAIGQSAGRRLDAAAVLVPPGEAVGLVVWTSRNHPHVRPEQLRTLVEKRAAVLRAELEARGIAVAGVRARVLQRAGSDWLKPERGALVIVPLGDLPRAR